MSTARPVKVLIAKPGIDGHDRGAKVLVRLLRDAGMEVVYTGLRRPIPAIVAAAVQEDVDVIGLSIMSGGAVSFVRELLERLAAFPDQKFVILVGGVIVKQEQEILREMGIEGIFPLGTPGELAIAFIQRKFPTLVGTAG